MLPEIAAALSIVLLFVAVRYMLKVKDRLFVYNNIPTDTKGQVGASPDAIRSEGEKGCCGSAEPVGNLTAWKFVRSNVRGENGQWEELTTDELDTLIKNDYPERCLVTTSDGKPPNSKPINTQTCTDSFAQTNPPVLDHIGNCQYYIKHFPDCDKNILISPESGHTKELSLKELCPKSCGTKTEWVNTENSECGYNQRNSTFYVCNSNEGLTCKDDKCKKD